MENDAGSGPAADDGEVVHWETPEDADASTQSLSRIQEVSG